MTSSPVNAKTPKQKPTRIEPEKLKGKERRAARRARDESQGGTENGTFEFVLGSLTAVVTGVVIGRGCLGNPWLFRDLLAVILGQFCGLLSVAIRWITVQDFHDSSRQP